MSGPERGQCPDCGSTRFEIETQHFVGKENPHLGALICGECGWKADTPAFGHELSRIHTTQINTKADTNTLSPTDCVLCDNTAETPEEHKQHLMEAHDAWQSPTGRN